MAADASRGAFWRRHLRVGVVLSVAAAALVMGYAAATPGRPGRSHLLALAIFVAVVTPAVLLLPIERLARDRRAVLFFYGWSLAVTLVVVTVVRIDGGGGSPLVLLLVLTLAFSGAAYPAAGVLLTGLLMVGSYLIVVVSGPAVPVSTVGAVAGTLGLFTAMTAWTSANAWNDYDQQVLLAARLATLARIDPLTGVLNRRALTERLSDTLADGAAHGRHTSVCMADLDGFKQVNDQLGHATGDRVLERVAQLLEAAVRGNGGGEPGCVGRIGGDEFVLVLPGADAADAARTVDGLRAALLDAVDLHGVTVSMGVASTSTGVPPEHLLHEADAQMYAQKDASRTAAGFPQQRVRAGRRRL